MDRGTAGELVAHGALRDYAAEAAYPFLYSNGANSRAVAEELMREMKESMAEKRTATCPLCKQEGTLVTYQLEDTMSPYTLVHRTKRDFNLAALRALGYNQETGDFTKALAAICPFKDMGEDSDDFGVMFK